MVVPFILLSMVSRLLLQPTHLLSGGTMMLMVQVFKKLTLPWSIVMKTPPLSAKLVLPL
jgi:hypothetical protein